MGPGGRVEIPLVKLSCGGESRDVRIEKDRVRLGDKTMDLRFSEAPGGAGGGGGKAGQLEIWLGGEWSRAAFARDGDRLLVWSGGRTFAFERAAGRSGGSTEHSGSLAAPMPGRVRRALVKEGERVEKGQVVLVLEAMKMEHAIRAPGGGVIKRFVHAEGDLVDAGTLLVVIE